MRREFPTTFLADRLLFAAFLGLIFWAPLPLGSNRPWAWAILEIWVFVLSLFWLCAYLSGHVRLSAAARSSVPVLALLCSWLAFLLFQIVPLPFTWVEWLSPEAARMHALVGAFTQVPARVPLSVDPHASFVSGLKSVAYVLVFAGTLQLVTTRERLRALAFVIVFSALFQALYGSLMTISGLEYGFFFRKDTGVGHATGTFVSRTHLAGYLEMGLAAGIGLLIGSLRSGSSGHASWRGWVRDAISLLFSGKLVLRACLAAMVIGLVLTRSRMGNTAFFFSLFIAGILGLALSRHATRSTVVLLASLIIIDLFIVGAYFGVEKVAQRIEETTFEKETRDEVNVYGLEQWRDYRWVGSGAGTFYVVFPRYRKEDVGVFYDHAHNDYLEFATDVGVVGMALLAAVVVLSLGAALVAQLRRRDPLMRGMGFAGVMGIVSLLIHSAVDFNLQIPANAMTFMIVLALCWLALYLDSSGRIPASQI